MKWAMKSLRLGRRFALGVAVAALCACVLAPSYPGPTPLPMPSFAPGTWHSEDWGATVTLRPDGTGSATRMPAWSEAGSECYIDTATFEDYNFTWWLGGATGDVVFKREDTNRGATFSPWGRYDHDWSAIVYFTCIPDGPGTVLLGRVE